MHLTAQDRLELINSVLKKKKTVSQASREMGVSRKTFYKWLKRYNDAPPEKKFVSLKDRKWTLSRQGRKTPTDVEKLMLDVVARHPELGYRGIRKKLIEATGKPILSRHAVKNILSRYGLRDFDAKKTFGEHKGRHRLTPQERYLIFEAALKEGKPVSQVCRDYGISRKTYYKWLKRYQKSEKFELETFRNREWKIDKHPRRIPESLENKIIALVAKRPGLSSHKLAEIVSIGNHGAYNVLVRHGLNTYEQRFAYAQQYGYSVSSVRPVTGWLNRVKQVFEQFLPGRAPAPPPSPRLWRAGPSFFKQLRRSSPYLLFSFLALFGLFGWGRLLGSAESTGQGIGFFFASIALSMGTLFFLYSLKYYFTLAVVLSFSREEGEVPKDQGLNGSASSFLGRLFGFTSEVKSADTSEVSFPAGGQAGGLQPNLEEVELERYPFISVHLPMYNEKRVAERILRACTSFDYPHFEIVVADDSTDETTEIVRRFAEEWNEVRKPQIKVIHRDTREGFKGGALREALRHTDKRAEFIVVFDADFVPYPDTLELFLKYFQANAGTLRSGSASSVQRLASNSTSEVKEVPTSEVKGYQDSNIAAIQGYQWHVLNKSENWITRGVRSEYAGSYVIERSGEELYGGLKQIAGSVYMIRRDLLDRFGWGTSLTEDFELTLKLYEAGYKVVYTPYIQAPAECASTLKRLVRQRMRWAEGHSFNIRRMFARLLFGRWSESTGVPGGANQELGIRNYGSSSPDSSFMLHDSQGSQELGKVWAPSRLTLSEKLEFLYLSPYYLQAAFFLIGTVSWLISETVFAARLPFWTTVWGWSLVLTNMLSLPLMNTVGLFLEEAEEMDFAGIFSFVALSYILVPFQAYASVKGFLESEEGPWFRTPKTGLITDVLTRGRFYRFIRGIFPGRLQPLVAERFATMGLTGSDPVSPYLVLSSANNRFGAPPVGREGFVNGIIDGFWNLRLFGRGVRVAKRYVFTKGVLAGFLAIVMMLNYMALFVYEMTDTRMIANRERMQTNERISSLAPDSLEAKGRISSDSRSGGQVITTVGGAVNTNLVENPEAVALANPKPGQVYAAEVSSGQGQTLSVGDEVYRWEVEMPNGTTYYFGLQEPQGIRPVVKIRSQDWWYVKYEARITNNESGIYVEPKVEGNLIEWELPNGVVAKYTALNGKIKADYIVQHPSALIGGNQLQFLVNYNDSDAGTPEEIEERPWEGHLTPELLPEGPSAGSGQGDISWFGENGREIFSFPKPVIYESGITNNELGEDRESTQWEGEYTIKKISQGTSLLSVVLPQDKLDSAVFPIIIDPVVIDSSAASTATAFGNGRNLVRDSFGNLIALLASTAIDEDDHVWFKNASATSWTDENIDLDSSTTLGSPSISADLDSSGNVQVAFESTVDTLYLKLTVTRDESNNITSISKGNDIKLDDTSPGVANNRPSLIVANKGEGAGKEKIAVAWAMNSDKGGTKRGEIRFLQCDVADDCTADANWKNASEDRNGSGTCNDASSGNVGLPNAFDCRGAADAIDQFTSAHVIGHGVLMQYPGRPQRTPTNAKWDDNGTFSNLSNALDDNTSTHSSLNALSSTQDYLYIGDDNVFSKVVVDVDEGNTNSSGEFLNGTTQYCSAVDGSNNCTTWSTLGNFADNTMSASSDSFSENGSMLFDEPSSWVKANVPDGSDLKYWIRFRPNSDFDASVQVTEFDVTDRHSKDLLLVSGQDRNGADSLGAGYVVWDGVDQDKWENNPAAAANPEAGGWRWVGNSIGGSANSGADWETNTNFPLTLTMDYINNNAYVAMVDSGGPTLGVFRNPVTNDPTATFSSGTWVNTSFPSVTEASDIVLSLTSDGADIYLFYVLDPETNSLVWRKCDPGGGGDAAICDNSADWGSENTLVDFVSGTEEPTHPQAIVSKAYGDTIAIDVIYTELGGTDEVKYERHLVDMADNTEVVAASGDDAFHRDCDSGTDDQDIAGTTAKLGREADDAGCSPTTVESENHAGFRFTTVNVAQGANISSAYLDFRVNARTGSTVVDFTVYGEDVDDSAAFSALTDCTDPCSGAVGERTRTTTNSSQSIDFETQSFRIDVTDMVQEVVCRGASDAQPCVGNFNGTGTWAANNDLALLLISAEGGTTDNFALITAEDASVTVMLDPTLQINCAVSGCGTGNAGQQFSAGVVDIPTDSADLDHPLANAEFTSVNTDDTNFMSISAFPVASQNTSANPFLLFRANNTNNNNTDDLSAEVIVKSTIPTKSYGGPHATGKTICFQLYNNTSAAWETYDCNGPGTASVCSDAKSSLTCDTAFAADTDMTLNSGTITGDTKYYTSEAPGGTCSGSGNDCWAAWRVYQEASDDGSNQIFYADFFSPTFVPERVLWLLPLALFMPRIITYIKRRRNPRRVYANVLQI